MMKLKLFCASLRRSLFDLPAMPSSRFEIEPLRLCVLRLPLHGKALRRAGGYSAVRPFASTQLAKKLQTQMLK